MLSSHEMGVLSVGSSDSCEVWFGEGDDKEGVGRGVDDWVSSSPWGGAAGWGEHRHCNKIGHLKISCHYNVSTCHLTL